MSDTIHATEDAKQTESTRSAPKVAGLAAVERRVWVWFGRALFVLFWLGSWQLMSGWLIDPFFSSSPSAIVVEIADWVAEGSIWKDIATTLKETLLGLVLGGAAGIVVGFLLGRAKLLADILSPFVTMMYSLPKLALSPLFILWFGIGIESKVVLVMLIVFFLVFFNTFAGARDVDPLLVDVVAILGADRLRRYTKVIVPSAMNWVVTGIRIAVPQALIGAIVGELISSNRGLGFVISNAASFFDTTGVLSGVVVVAILSLIMTVIVGRFEKWALRWREA